MWKINKKIILLSIFLLSLVNIGSASATTVYVDPTNYTATGLGDVFTIEVNITDVTDLYGYEFKLFWNNTLLENVSLVETPPAVWGTDYIIYGPGINQSYNETHGRYYRGVSALPPSPPFTGDISVVSITFKAIYQPYYPEGNGFSVLDLVDTMLVNSTLGSISHEVVDGEYWILSVPSPLQCGITITENTEYDASDTLEAPPFNDDFACITIGADDITLDCGGATLIGNTSGIGVYANGKKNVIIKGCNIRNFAQGINITNSNDSTVFNNTIKDNKEASIYLSNSDNITIESNNVTNTTGSYGIYLKSSDKNRIIKNKDISNHVYGIYLSNSNDNTVKDNVIYNNTEGVRLDYSNNDDIIDNTIYNNSDYGVFLDSSLNNTVTNNTVYLNKKVGIFLRFYSYYNNMTNNRLYNNTYGILLREYSRNNTMTNNTIYNNTYGIRLREYSSYNTIINNTANSNSNKGFYLSYSNRNMIGNNSLYDNNISIYLIYSGWNNITNNTIYNNTWDGIHIFSSSPNNTITDNIIRKNVKSGIYIFNSKDNRIEDNNRIINNSYGIYMKSANYTDITNNNVSLNKRHGIYMEASTNDTITNNTIYNNTWDGIYATFSSNNNSIKNNNITINRKGIDIRNSNFTTIGNNNISSNRQIGIYLWRSNNNAIENNTIFNNAREGIYLHVRSHRNNITNNNITNNERYGIHFDSSDFNRIENNNNITNNGYSGILLNNSCDNNTINDNVVHHNGYRGATRQERAGIFLDYTSGNNTIINNNVSESHRHGVVIWRSDDNKIIRNNISNSGDDGIQLCDADRNKILDGNDIHSNRGDEGIHFYERSNNNVVRNNTIHHHRITGIFLGRSRTICWNPAPGLGGTGTGNIIDNNTIYENGINLRVFFLMGIRTLGDGIGLYGTQNTYIWNNTIYRNRGDESVAGLGYRGDGISLFNSQNNEIKDNKIGVAPAVANPGNARRGIKLHNSPNNDIEDNNIQNHPEGVNFVPIWPANTGFGVWEWPGQGVPLTTRQNNGGNTIINNFGNAACPGGFTSYNAAGYNNWCIRNVAPPSLFVCTTDKEGPEVCAFILWEYENYNYVYEENTTSGVIVNNSIPIWISNKTENETKVIYQIASNITVNLSLGVFEFNISCPNNCSVEYTPADEPMITPNCTYDGSELICFDLPIEISNETTFNVLNIYSALDSDGDSIPDDLDNCPYTYNPDQNDSDGTPIQDFVSYWKFDEGNGTTANDSADANNGTIYGATWTSGQVDDALSFDGIDDHVEINDSDNLDITDEITLEAWVYRRQSDPPHQRIISKYFWYNITGSTGSWVLFFDTTNKSVCYMNISGTFNWTRSISPIPLNTWTHVACTFNGTHLIHYVNGDISDSLAVSGTIGTSDYNVAIGVSTDNTWYENYFNGTIDEVAIYKKALTPTEIEQHYQKGLLGKGYLGDGVGDACDNCWYVLNSDQLDSDGDCSGIPMPYLEDPLCGDACEVALSITISSPQNCTDYPNCTNSSYYKREIPLNFTVNSTISYAGYSLDGEAEVNVTDNTTYNGTHTVGYEKFDAPDGFHNITVVADEVSSDPVYFFYCRGDVDKNKEVDIVDVVKVAIVYGTKCGDEDYDPEVDLNDDCIIDIVDIVIVAIEYGKNC